MKKINFKNKYSKFSDYWSPKVIAEMNDYQFKAVKIKGEFIWHKHDSTDETFIVIDGSMVIEFRDGEVQLDKGEMYVVPKGVVHRPYADKECKVILIEPKGIVNTGDADSGTMTAENDVWI